MKIDINELLAKYPIKGTISPYMMENIEKLNEDNEDEEIIIMKPVSCGATFSPILKRYIPKINRSAK